MYKRGYGRMSSSTHAEDLKLRLMTIELLRTAKYKRNITYRELASKTGLPVCKRPCSAQYD